MSTCPNGHSVEDGGPFCGECGVSVSVASATCPRGHAIEPTGRFCPECGLEAAAAPTVVSPGATGAPSVDGTATTPVFVAAGERPPPQPPPNPDVPPVLPRLPRAAKTGRIVADCHGSSPVSGSSS